MSAFIVGGTAHAQGTGAGVERAPILRDWKREIYFGISPTLGQNSPAFLETDIIDDSGAEFYIRATRPLIGPINLRFQAGLAASPNLLDGDAVASGYYGQVSLGEADDSLTRFLALNSAGVEVPASLQDTVLPYARYRYTRNFEGTSLFRTDKAKDNQFVIGLRFRDVRGIMCEPREIERRRNTPSGPKPDCSGPRGLYLEFDPRLTLVESNDPLRDRMSPSFRGQIVSRPLGPGIRLFGEAYGEISYYDSSRVPSGERREDRLRRFTAGLYLSDITTPALRRFTGLGEISTDVSIALRYEQKFSNKPDTAYERWFLVVGASLTYPF